jgi:hypothetical protein
VAWDTDELLWDAHGNRDVLGRLATDRPHVVKLYGAYQFPFGTQVGAFFYGGSGTPISTQVITMDSYAPFVNGRGDMGRTPVLTRTDLLVSHELSMMQGKKVRFELNIQNLFNQKTATHIFNFLNKGAPGGSRAIASDAIDLAGNWRRAAGLQRPDSCDGEGANVRPDTPAGSFQPGMQGHSAVKFCPNVSSFQSHPAFLKSGHLSPFCLLCRFLGTRRCHAEDLSSSAGRLEARCSG